MSNQNNLTQEQIALGQLYVWIHRRAEYLRAKQEAESGRVSEAQPESADGQALKPNQGDSITLLGNSQTDENHNGT